MLLCWPFGEAWIKQESALNLVDLNLEFDSRMQCLVLDLVEMCTEEGLCFRVCR